MERERPTEMPRNGLGLREPARALVLVLGDPPSPLHHVPADEATKRGAIFWLQVCTADLARVPYVLYCTFAGRDVDAAVADDAVSILYNQSSDSILRYSILNTSR
jgi:hypothetical protein